MPGFTNKGVFRMLGVYFRASSAPTNFFVALFTSAAAPGPDTNVHGDLTEIASGNGYTSGGISVSRNATDFDVLTEDDSNDRGIIQIKDLVWTASGGNLPASGGGARYAGLTDDAGTVASREVISHWDLVSDRVVSSGQTLTLQNCELRLQN